MRTGFREISRWCPSLDDAGSGTDTLTDLASGGVDGSLLNGAGWVADTSNEGIRAIAFNGTDQRVLIADSDRYTFSDGSADLPFSIAIWFYANSYAASGLIGKASGLNVGEWYVSTDGIGRLFFRCVDNSSGGYIGLRINSAFSLSTWHSLVCTYDGSGSSPGMSMRIDGTLPGLSNSSSGSYARMRNTTEQLRIGSRGDALFLSGKFDDAAIFPRVLSTKAIAALSSRRGFVGTNAAARRRQLLTAAYLQGTQ